MKYRSPSAKTQAKNPAGRWWRWPLVLGLAVAAWLGIKHGRKFVLYDKLGMVEAGRVYRSGQLKGFQIERLARRRGLRTVVALREADVRDTVIREQEELCRRLGIDLVWIEMPGCGRGTYEAYDEALRVLEDETRLPALMHCARGTHRTGAVAAAYRVGVQGWAPEDAMAEMPRYRFRPRGHPLVSWLEPYLQNLHLRRQPAGSASSPAHETSQDADARIGAAIPAAPNRYN